MKLWLIIYEQETCEALVRELEVVLAAEASTDKEEELAQERVRDKVKRQLAAHQRRGVEESEEENEETRRRKEMRRRRMSWKAHLDFWHR